jgi:hypothetical protein
LRSTALRLDRWVRPELAADLGVGLDGLVRREVLHLLHLADLDDGVLRSRAARAHSIASAFDFTSIIQ